MAEVQEGAVGVPIVIAVKNPDGTARDISSATTKNLILGVWKGTKVTKPGTFLNDGKGGLSYYRSVAPTDWTPGGVGEVKADIVQPGYSGRSRIACFDV